MNGKWSIASDCVRINPEKYNQIWKSNIVNRQLAFGHHLRGQTMANKCTNKCFFLIHNNININKSGSLFSVSFPESLSPLFFYKWICICLYLFMALKRSGLDWKVRSSTLLIILIIVASYIVLISISQWISRRFTIQFCSCKVCGTTVEL